MGKAEGWASGRSLVDVREEMLDLRPARRLRLVERLDRLTPRRLARGLLGRDVVPPQRVQVTAETDDGRACLPVGSL